jgi:lantibiotic modifying enzyme
MPWKPLLAGELKDQAWDRVRAIVDDLPTPAHDPFLASGAAGLALLHGYLAMVESSGDRVSCVVNCLQSATKALADRPVEASLYSGLTGVGWAMQHLQRNLTGLDGEDELSEIDEVLLHHLRQSPWRENFDLVGGVVGLGIYALERLPAAASCLERVIDHLCETAEHQATGITWWTNPAWLPQDTRTKYPLGYYNLGLAHGVPGVIAFLGRVCAAGVAVAKARPLLEGAVRWQLAQQQPGGFAAFVGPAADPQPARLAWCYGDPGVAVALLGAARCVGEPAGECAARAIIRRAATRPAEQAGVVDAGLCHGAAGLGHLFNRLYQATGEPLLGESARFWFERALAMHRPGHGIGGYEAWRAGDDGELTWVADTGLLTGAVGIALALLAAITPIEPAWDQMLLAAIPPTAAA